MRCTRNEHWFSNQNAFDSIGSSLKRGELRWEMPAKQSAQVVHGSWHWCCPPKLLEIQKSIETRNPDLFSGVPVTGTGHHTSCHVQSRESNRQMRKAPSECFHSQPCSTIMLSYKLGCYNAVQVVIKNVKLLPNFRAPDVQSPSTDSGLERGCTADMYFQMLHVKRRIRGKPAGVSLSSHFPSKNPLKCEF